MRNDRNLKLNIGFLCLLFILVCGLMVGCGMSGEGPKVVLTTGLSKDEVFRIESISCSKPEMMVYLTNMQNQYENVYGEEIWDTQVDGRSLENSVKENALAKMAQVKTMNLMAHDMEIELTSQELKQIELAADVYYGSLNNTEIEAMGIDRTTIISLYKEYVVAQKVYHNIIKDINPEVSDDEARNITIDYILIKTYAQDSSGKRTEFNDFEKKSAYARAEQARKRAIEDEDFDTLIAEYNEDTTSTVSVGKTDLETDYLRTNLFNLANGEVSQILTTDDGYLIAKCMSTYDLEETDANKITIVEQQREYIFGEEYDSYIQNLTRKLNDSLWNSITFLHSPDITTSDFFVVADEYFSF